MIDYVQQLSWWHWIIGALVLGALETFIPGAVAIWFAVSAAVVGLLLAVVPLPWQYQWVLFAVLGLVAVIGFRSYRKAHPDVEERPTLNHRAEQYVGDVFTLVEPINQGYGKIRVGDGVWKVSGHDAPAGTAVRVVGVDGAILKVKVE